MTHVLEFITDYVQREYPLDDGVDILTLDYVQSGYIDSLGIIRFYAELEDAFGITLTDEELSNPSIHVVANLVALIEEKMNTGRK